MARKLSGLFFAFLFLFSSGLSLVPLQTAEAAESRLIFCGRSQDDPLTMGDDSAPCTMCHLVLTGKAIIDWLMQIMVIVALTIIVAMAIWYIVSAGNPGMIKTAKAGITASLVGFALILGAWLIVNTVLMMLANTTEGPLKNLVSSGGFAFACNASSSAATSTLAPSSGGAATSGSSSVPLTGGSCSPLTNASNPCSVSNLETTCFAAHASQISQLCNKESGGVPNSKSGVDVCGNYGNRAFSGGLFQINIFANGSMLDKARCSNLGSKGSCANRRASDGVCLSWNCSITNVSDFDYCMGLTFTAANNIAAACKLSNNGTNLTPWACSANKCNLGGTSSTFCK